MLDVLLSQLFGGAQRGPLMEQLLVWAQHVAQSALLRWPAVASSGIRCSCGIRCSQPAVAACAICQAPVCLAHAMVAQNADMVCLPCVNRAAEALRRERGEAPPRPGPRPVESNEDLRRKHLKTLGLKGDPSADEIKARYRELAVKHHPDRQRSEGKRAAATQKLVAINEAYAWLTREEKKAA